MTDADLRMVCAQEGINGAGAMADVQSRLHLHLFGQPRTPTEAVHAACDAELASALLSATASDDDPAEHSAAGAWLASGLRYLLGRQVTAKALLRLKIKFRRAGQAHDEVVFAQDMKPGDPGFVQFVEAWVTRIIAVMPLPNAMTTEDAEASLSDVLRALGAPAGPRASPLGAPQPLDWLAELRRASTTKSAAEDAFDNPELNKAITMLRSYGFYVDKNGAVKFSQLTLISKATAAKEDGLSTPNLCVDPRVQPGNLRAMLDAQGNFAPDQTKMVQQQDGSYVEATTTDPVSKKTRSAMEVARGHSMYWVAHLVTSIRHTALHSKYASRTTTNTGLWLHPYYVAKFQAVLWRVVDRVSGDTLDGILTPLLQYVQERTNTADEDAWTGEAAVEYVCAKLSEQVSFAAAMTGKRKADTPQGGKPQKSSAGGPVACTVCKKNKTTHASKVCLACAQAKKATGAPAAAAAAPAAAAAAPAAGL